MREVFTPRVWHPKALKFLMGRNRLQLMAGMGTGKTMLTYSAIQGRRLLGHLQRPTLVIAPRAVAIGPWSLEAEKWELLEQGTLFGLKVSVVIGSAEERMHALRQTADAYVINYENIPWLLEQTGGNLPFDLVVCDESPRLKNARPSWHKKKDGGLYLKVGGGSSRAGELAHAARYGNFPKYWLNLTGTPVPNGLADIWGQVWFLDFGERLGQSFTAFQRKYFTHIPEAGKRFIKPGAFEIITNKLQDITMTIDPCDYYDIGKPIYTTVEVPLTPKLSDDYRELHKKFVLEVGGVKILTASAAAKGIKCLQFCNGAIYPNEVPGEDAQPNREAVQVHDLKIERLKNLREELNGANLLVAYWFRSDLAKLQKHFPDAVVMPRESKKQIEVMAAWNKGDISMLLANPASAGHGLNLQNGGHHICFYSHWYSGENHDQIIERIGPVRQFQAGFKRPVHVYYLLATTSSGGRTADHSVFDVLVNKKEFSATLNEAMK